MRLHNAIAMGLFGATSGKGGAMDFAAILLVVNNTLLAVFIYIVVTRIWQD